MVERINRLSLYVFYGLLAYMPLHIFLSTWLGTSFNVLESAKIAKDVVLVMGFGLILIASITKPWFAKFIKMKLVWLLVSYAFINLVLALVKPTDTDAEVLGFVYNTRFLLFFLYAWLLTYHFNALHIRRRAVQIVLTVGTIVSLFGIVQYLVLPNDALGSVGYSRENGVLPAFFIDEKPDLERVMSTVRDPNSFGSYLIIISLIVVACLLTARAKRLRIILGGTLAAALLSLWLSFSRSAWLGFMLAIGVFAIMYKGKLLLSLQPYRKLIVYTGSVVIITGIVCLAAFKDSYFVQNVIFHADESTVLENPNELRVRFWKESFSNIVAEPEGSGPGTAGLASIRNEKQGVELNENYYLQIGSELGILGLVLFLGVLSGVGYRLYIHRSEWLAHALLASLAGLMLTNFLVHIWSNEAVAYTWWGLAGLIMYRKTRNSHNKGKTS